ncbi:MAG TPA: hypothetical protein VE077_00630 [Candidatus Methylomirabilis sp.]|nr:hypothetical protein [Candidatus Methylomirabilis sp.]
MQCRDVELVLEQEGLEPLPEEARAHLASCLQCRNYVADLTSLVDAAKKLPREVTPPDRVWLSLRAQLEAEGIIKPQPEIPTMPAAPWWESIAAFFRHRGMAAAMIAILLVAGGVFLIRSRQVTNIAKAPVVTSPQPVPPQTPSVAANSLQPPSEFAGAAQALDDQEPLATGMILASSSPVDASLRDNLKKVNEFIAECERHLKAQPRDDLTREYLSVAYQQKAELLSAIIERGRSVN